MSNILKSVRVLVALALVLSLGLALVPAMKVTPVMAQPTTYYVDDDTGNDTFGDGSETWVDTDTSGGWTSGDTGPWKTITHALTQVSATEGDTLVVAPGLYDNTNNGETFPLVIDVSLTLMSSGGAGVTTIDAEGGSDVIQIVTTGKEYVSGVPRRLGCWYDGTSYKLYVDGELVTTQIRSVYNDDAVMGMSLYSKNGEAKTKDLVVNYVYLAVEL